ncbi:hypothetical protein M378DRAFT_166801 [Amanita muscaria Koide BX008]|uniref:C2H2-type domain-containing protein n=1 Tax=Amanita muscaria (strain Koide BX008) TaxID=946122 RepID=A0A0C2T4S2_AMAMK|nr:hypothetical protein M378DRAFT_166801 [Amanita muscaria Koide BX008]
MPPSSNVPPNYFMHSVPTLSFPPSSCGGIERPDSEIFRHPPLSDLGPASVTLRSDPHFVWQDPSSSLEPASATLRPDPVLFLQDIDAKPMTVRARFDASWQEWQDLLGQKQDALARRSAQMSSICKTATLLPNEGEAWTIAPHTLAPPQPILSSPSAMTSAQPKTQSRPAYTVYNREGNKIFRCQCGHKTLRKGDMTRHHQSLVHASKSQGCSCGKRYTRKDSLRRHKMACIYSLV